MLVISIPQGIVREKHMKCLLGEKRKMSQIFTEDGVAVPVTVISAEPATVVFTRTEERDGYRAVQIGSGSRKEKNTPKPERGHTGDLGAFKTLREFRISGKDTEPAAVGEMVDVTQFSPGDVVSISAITKGKGFQGGVKRHNFSGGPRTHGQKHSEREPGSIGATGPQRVLKGTKMAGRMGGKRHTLKKVRVVKVLPEENQILVRGAIPGRPGAHIEIKAQ